MEFLERRDICVLNIPNPNSQSRHTPGQLTCSLNSSDFRNFHALCFLVLTAQLSGLLKYVIIWKPLKPVILVDKYVEQGTPNPYWVWPNTLSWSPQRILPPLLLSSCCLCTYQCLMVPDFISCLVGPQRNSNGWACPDEQWARAPHVFVGECLL